MAAKTGSLNFFQQILKVDEASISLNYLFDNIRNYTLATPVMFAGLWLLMNDGLAFDLPYVNLIFGLHIAICGFVLICLNFVHSILTITKSFGKLWPGYVIYITMFIGSLEVVWVGFWKFLA